MSSYKSKSSELVVSEKSTMHTIQQAAAHPRLLHELDILFRELDRRIAAHQPTCRNRGACCKFGAFGHKLYVTTLELAYFHAKHPERFPLAVADSGPLESATAHGADPQDRTCPFQENGLCTTREGRPLGCRVFFCESADEDWQGAITEWALAQLRELHQRFGIAYSYVEWLSALGSEP